MHPPQWLVQGLRRRIPALYPKQETFRSTWKKEKNMKDVFLKKARFFFDFLVKIQHSE